MLAAVTATARLGRGEGGLARRDGLIIHFAAGAVIVVVISAQDLVDTFPGGARPVYTPSAQTVWISAHRNAAAERRQAAPDCPAFAGQPATARSASPATIAESRQPQDEPPIGAAQAPCGDIASRAGSPKSTEQTLAASGDGP